MTPVEEVNTALVGKLRLAAIAVQIRSTDAFPAVPVKALALPEFTSIAAPCDISPFILAWQSSTHAARVAERVNTPAIADPAAIEASITSVRPGYFTPAAAAANFTPSITARLGKTSGAKGDIFIISQSDPR